MGSSFAYAGIITHLSAQFVYRGINYQVTSPHECEVAWRMQGYSASAVVIPDSVQHNNRWYKVTAVGDRAFEEAKLTRIRLPQSIRRIGNYAFYECKLLKSFTCPDSLRVMDTAAFAFCYQLSHIRSNDSLRIIGEGAFRECWNIRKVRIPEGVQQVNALCFYNCKRLTEANIPSGVSIVRRSSYRHCPLKKIIVPAKVHEIEENAFSVCDTLIIADSDEEILYTNDFSEQNTRYVYFGRPIHPWHSYEIIMYGLDTIVLGEKIGRARFLHQLKGKIKTVICKSVKPFDAYPFTMADLTQATLYVPSSGMDLYRKHEVFGKFRQIKPL